LTYYFDSSALVKFYHRESGSSRVEALFAESNRQILISRLTAVELYSALSIKVRTGQLGGSESAALRTRFANDVTVGDIAVIATREHDYTIAENLIIQYGDRMRLRTLDALQLAVALELRRRVGLDALVVADISLAEIARTEGIAVINPEVNS